MHSLTLIQIKQFRRTLHAFFKKNRRDLPWRRTHDPYKILVSEIMLQQTQVSRVLKKYKSWLKAFPNVRSLAAASLSEVLKEWKGEIKNGPVLVRGHHQFHQTFSNWFFTRIRD